MGVSIWVTTPKSSCPHSVELDPLKANPGSRGSMHPGVILNLLRLLKQTLLSHSRETVTGLPWRVAGTAESHPLIIPDKIVRNEFLLS